MKQITTNLGRSYNSEEKRVDVRGTISIIVNRQENHHHLSILIIVNTREVAHFAAILIYMNREKIWVIHLTIKVKCVIIQTKLATNCQRRINYVDFRW